MDFKLEIPEIMTSLRGQDEIDYSLIQNKYIIGLLGYSRSGKDSCAKFFIDKYGFKRIAFADKLKEELNLHCKEITMGHLRSIGDTTFSDSSEIDFFTDHSVQKKVLRTYMIWFSENIKKICGDKIWVNKALADTQGYDRIIVTDMRRIMELNVFEDSPYLRTRDESFCSVNNMDPYASGPDRGYYSLVFEVSQFGLTDNDVLTHEALEYARRNWLIADTIRVDSRVPDDSSLRNSVLHRTLKSLVDKFGIVKPATQLPGQLKIF